MPNDTFPCQPLPEHEQAVAIALNQVSDPVMTWHAWRREFNSSLTAPGVRELLPICHLLFKESLLDSEVKELFRDEYARIGRKNMLGFDQLVPLLETLNGEGLDYLVIKGLSLLPYFGDNPALRPMADIDLLIRHLDTRWMMEHLVATGWRPYPAFSVYHLLNNIVPNLHSWGFHKNGVSIDLHWLPNDREYGDCGTQRIWRSAISEQILGRSVRIPCAEDAVLLALIHGIRPQVNRRSQWIVDVTNIITTIGQNFNWEKFSNNVRMRKLDHTTGNMLDYLRQHFNLDVPMHVLPKSSIRPWQRAEYLAWLRRANDRSLKQKSVMACYKNIRNLQNRWIDGHHSSPSRSVSSIAQAFRNTVRERLYSARFDTYFDHRNPSSHMTWMEQPAPFHNQVSKLGIGQKIRFSSSSDGFRFTIDGWAAPEKEHQWNDGFSARVAFSLKESVQEFVALVFEMQPYKGNRRGRNRIGLTINGCYKCRIDYLHEPAPSHQRIIVSADLLKQGRIDVRFIMPDARYLSKATRNGDSRRLGLCLQSIQTQIVPCWDTRRTLMFHANSDGRKCLGYGWWMVEEFGVWNAMERMNIKIPLPDGQSIKQLELNLSSVVVADRLDVRVSGAYTAHSVVQIEPNGQRTLLLDVVNNPSHDGLRFIELQFVVNTLQALGSGPEGDHRHSTFMLESISAVR
jgi:hypothetical protein